MSLTLLLKNFSVNCMCSSYNLKEFYSSCNSFSCFFETNVYLLYGEIDCGAWAFVNSISSNCVKKHFGAESIVVLNQQKLTAKEWSNMCCYLHCKTKHNIFNRSFKKSIIKNIKKYNYGMSYSQLFNLFEIPSEIQNKKVNRLGMYYPCYLAMLGLIKGYKIFATSWQGRYGFDSYIIDKIADAVIHTNGILLVPTDKQNIFKERYVKMNMVDLFDDYRIREKYKDQLTQDETGDV